MAQLEFRGPLRHRISSFWTLNRICIAVGLRHLFGVKMAPDWDWLTEVGIRFWRHQFNDAMRHPNIETARARFNSLLTKTDDVYDVTVTEDKGGRWIVPRTPLNGVTLLYLHGGGYAFAGPVSDRYGAMLAHHTGARLYKPAYRLTPEHCHPAQIDDALAAWERVTRDVPPEQVVAIGDSAGGHLALMLLQALRTTGRAQPRLCVALCPWTDIGARGASLTENDQYDLVQGWMALKFGDWLDPGRRYGRDALSPIAHDFAGLAPIYLQVGGREVLRDMILEFAEVQAWNGADVMVDLWPDMPHNFQAYDSTFASSQQALARITQIVQNAADGVRPLAQATEQTYAPYDCFSEVLAAPENPDQTRASQSG